VVRVDPKCVIEISLPPRLAAANAGRLQQSAIENQPGGSSAEVHLARLSAESALGVQCGREHPAAKLWGGLPVNRALTVCTLLVTMLLTAPVAAQTDADNARKKLQLFNDEIKRGFSALAGGWGADPDGEQRRVDEAVTIAQAIQPALGDDLSVAGEPYQRVKQNLNALLGEIENAKLAVAYAAAERAIRERHKRNEAASADELKALNDAVTGLKTRAGPGWANTVAHFETRGQRISKDRETLVAISAKPAAAAAPVAPPPAPPAAAPAGLAEAMKEANRQRRSLIRHLEDEPYPIPESMLASYREASSKVSALSERAGRYYTTVYRSFLIANAWRKPDNEAFTTLPGLYQGDLLGQGTAKRKLKASFNGLAGWCYAVAMRFRDGTGGEGLKDVSLTSKPRSELQRFDVPHTGPGWQRVEGVCPAANGKLTLSAKIEGDKKAEVRWVVMGWPKETLPMFVAQYMRLLAPDRCDDKLWYRAWTRPVPGTLAYKGGEPHLLLDVKQPPSDEIVALNLVGERVTLRKGDLASTSPDKRTFTTEFSWKGCAPTDDASGDAKKLASCLARIEKKYAKNIEREEKRLERATTDDAKAKSQARIDTLRGKEEAERAQKCEPISERIAAQGKRTFDRVLDLHTDNPVVTHLNRTDQLQAEQLADPELR
jgi:hypothetical protein